MDGKLITLAKPIDSHGETVTELTINEPTGEHCIRYGMPYSIDAETSEISIKMRTVSKLLTVCTDPPLTPKAIKSMSMSDLNECATQLVSFIQPVTKQTS